MNRVSVIIFILVSFIFSNNIEGWESLSLKEKIGQMIMVRVDGNYYQTDSRYKALFKKWISDYHVGGIITFNGKNFYAERRLGLVGDKFTKEKVLEKLPGNCAIGHNRYTTAGNNLIKNVQPFFADLHS